MPLCTNCNIKLNGAKCVVCAQVIESDGIMFNDRNYHKHCYLCDSCETDLTKMKKTLTDPSGQGKYCEPCHVKKYAPKCGKCGQSIPSYLPFTQFEGKHYHKECFACSRCKKSLANKKFFKTGNITICEQCN